MDYIKVGKIITSHGIKGEVKVFPLTDDIKRFSQLKTAYIGEKKLKVQLEGAKYYKNLAILKFKEFNDINEILAFKDCDLYVDEEGKVKLPKDHYFIYDLLGCKVYDTEAKLIGELIDVLQGSSNDVYVVKNIETNKENLIPVVKRFIVDVNIQEKRITIDPIEGMIE